MARISNPCLLAPSSFHFVQKSFCVVVREYHQIAVPLARAQHRSWIDLSMFAVNEGYLNNSDRFNLHWV